MNNGGKEGMLPVNYSGLIPVMIESIKDYVPWFVRHEPRPTAKTNPIVIG